MIKKVLIIWCMFYVLCLMPLCSFSSEKVKFHPRNIKLIKQGLIPPMKYFPDVPRITASEALMLYRSTKAMFIAIGHDAPRIDGHWVLPDYMGYNHKKLTKVSKKMMIITY